jgi:hypothetical protein
MDNPHLIPFLEMLKTKDIENIKKTIDYNGNTQAIIELPNSEYKKLLFSNGGALFGWTTKTNGYEGLYKLINSILELQGFDIVMISQYDDHPFSLSIEMKEKEKNIETIQSNTGGKKKRSKKKIKSTKKKRHIKKRRYTKKRR